ncbi:MAG: hypothetical protein R6V23_01305 [Bacteroidales bacterium]
MKKAIYLTAALTAVTLFSCEDDLTNKTDLTEQEEAVIMDDAASDNVIEASDYEVDFYTSSEETINEFNDEKKSIWWHSGRYVNGEGPAVTVDPIGTAYPKTITIDYGDGVELVYGGIISGKILIEISAHPLTNGSTRDITYENFYVDSIHIEGGATRTFTGTDSTERIFTSESNLILTFPDGTILNRTASKTRTLVEGFETPFVYSDDIILIDGVVNYETSNGTTFSKTTITPLTKTGACRFIIEGTVSFTLNGEEFAVLDYGDGTCDDIATITKDGETRQITIGRRIRRFWLR